METLAEASIHLLNEAAKSLPISEATNILKTYYSIKCRTVGFGNSLNLPQRFTKETVRCPRCCVQYQDTNDVKYQIKPERKQSKYARKLLKKHKGEKCLTKYQQKYLKRLIKKEDMAPHNFLQITCTICKKNSKNHLLKPKEEPTMASCITTQNESFNKKSNKRKNRKKKDRFSGLNMEAVLSANTTLDSSKSLNLTRNESFTTDDFIPLATPNRKRESVWEKDLNNKKNSLPHHQQMFDKIEKSKSKKMQKKNKEKKLKGLQNILNNSKQKSSPSATLKQFLTSI